MPDVARVLNTLDQLDALRLDTGRADESRGTVPRDIARAVDVKAIRTQDGDEDVSQLLIPDDVIERVLASDRGERSPLRGPKYGSPPGQSPSVDVLAWYQPIHFHGHEWGIYIREDALVDLAADLAPRVRGFHSNLTSQQRTGVLLRTAFDFLLAHEKYHHRVEALAVRLTIVEQKPRYPEYFDFVKRDASGTSADIEEALATASAWAAISAPTLRQTRHRTELRAIQAWAKDLFKSMPPGYNDASNYLPRPAFSAGQSLLAARVQEARASPSRQAIEHFTVATHLLQPICETSGAVYTIVPDAATASIFPIGGLPLQVPTRRLQKFLRKAGWELVARQGAGSHQKYRKDGAMIIVPDRKEVPDNVLHNTAKTLGMTVHDLARLAA